MSDLVKVPCEQVLVAKIDYNSNAGDPVNSLCKALAGFTPYTDLTKSKLFINYFFATQVSRCTHLASLDRNIYTKKFFG